MGKDPDAGSLQCGHSAVEKLSSPGPERGRPRNEGREQGRAEKREHLAGEGGVAGMGTG